MNLNNINIAYFIGVGGIGMSAIARYLCIRGIEVYGYDKVPSFITDELSKLGVKCHFNDDLDNLKEIIHVDKNQVLVIYTPAIPNNHKELNFFLSEGYNVVKRADALGVITSDKPTIGVAGTHGKTTTSSMVAHLLHSAGVDITAFLGGIATNYNSNLIASSQPQLYVVEADEFDRSFLKLKPETSIVTSVDADHLDIYGEHKELLKSFQMYADLTSVNLIVNEVVELDFNLNKQVYSVDNILTEVRAENIRVENGKYIFDYVSEAVNIKNLSLRTPGRHNVSNMVAAITATLHYTSDVNSLVKAVESFKGVKRRFEYHIDEENLIFVDDYAHHPTEINAFLSGINELYPDKKVTVVFQPHLFSRTRDFINEFALSLSQVNEVILLDIYPARELPIEGVDSLALLDLISVNSKSLMTKEQLVDYSLVGDFQVFVTIGAGDIDRLIPDIKMNLLENKRTKAIVN